MRVSLLLAACLAIGCTRPNGDYAGGGGNGGPGGFGGIGGGTGGNGNLDASSGGASDMTSPVTGARDMTSPPDLPPAVCAHGERRCVMQPVASEDCSSSGQWGVDRLCPYGSTKKSGAACASDYCTTPTTNGTLGCGTGGPLEQICSGQGGGMGPGPGTNSTFSCQPFVGGNTTEWWCAIAVVQGSGGAGDACSTGADCHGGFCGSNGTCFWACQTMADCPLAKGGGPVPAQMKCTPVTLTVEGKSITASSCTP